jgi:ligand-binding SRPBCC domain-containing protein
VGQRYCGAIVSRLRETIEIEARPDDVWRVVADPRNLPRWNRFIRWVHGVPENGLRAGTTYSTELGGFGLSITVRAEVEEIDPPRYSRVRLSGPFEALVTTWVRPAGSGRSRLEHEIDYHIPGGAVGELLARTVRLLGGRQLLRRGVRAQKRQVERGG